MSIAQKQLQEKVTLCVEVTYNYVYNQTQDHAAATHAALDALVENGLCVAVSQPNGAGTITDYYFKEKVSLNLDLNCDGDVFYQMTYSYPVKTYVVRDVDCKNFREISEEEREELEQKAGLNSAFGEAHLAVNGFMAHTICRESVAKFIEDRNS